MHRYAFLKQSTLIGCSKCSDFFLTNQGTLFQYRLAALLLNLFITSALGTYVVTPLRHLVILNFFKKIWPIPASLCIFSSFSHHNFNNTNWKSVDGALGIWTFGHRNHPVWVGTDKITELWRPPFLIYFGTGFWRLKCPQVSQWFLRQCEDQISTRSPPPVTSPSCIFQVRISNPGNGVKCQIELNHGLKEP